MGIPLLGAILQRIDIDNRILSATALVSVVGLTTRLYDPLFQYVWYVGLLGGFVNALRTNEWEFATYYGALPGLISAFLISIALGFTIALGTYTFPFDTPWTRALDSMGPVAEFHFYVVLYSIEGWIAFTLTRKVTGPEFITRLRSDTS